MKQIVILCFTLLLFSSCGSSKQSTTYKKPNKSKTEHIVNQAQSFAGTKYKFGGTTRKGMDCSGLIYVSFQKENIVLPRVSRDMANKGKSISKKDVKKGDLVFFKTNKNSARINHVGLVTKVKGGQIYFIHSTTSKGVITSSLDEKYWRNAYAQARRII